MILNGVRFRSGFKTFGEFTFFESISPASSMNSREWALSLATVRDGIEATESKLAVSKNGPGKDLCRLSNMLGGGAVEAETKKMNFLRYKPRVAK